MSTKPTFAQYLLLPVIGKGKTGDVNLHAPSCGVNQKAGGYGCCCAEVSDLKCRTVDDALLAFMGFKGGYPGYLGILMGSNHEAKLTMLRDMHACAEKLGTPWDSLPLVSDEDVKSTQLYLTTQCVKHSPICK